MTVELEGRGEFRAFRFRVRRGFGLFGSRVLGSGCLGLVFRVQGFVLFGLLRDGMSYHRHVKT